MHERLGAAGWARLSEQALADLPHPAIRTANEFRLVNGVRPLSFQGKQAQLPDSKGLRDLAVLIGAHGADVHVLTLLGTDARPHRRRPVLDDAGEGRVQGPAGSPGRRDRRGRRTSGSPGRAETLRAERDALIHELAAAAGLGGRDRRLGDRDGAGPQDRQRPSP